MPLQYLEFDIGEDSDGWTSASALACPAPQHLAALHAEVQALLHSLHRALGKPGPLDEGHRWDLDLQIDNADGQRLTLDALATAWPGQERCTLSLHLAGGGDLHNLLHTWMNP